ncbi:unnamed protein product [Calicophoron daubneyi]|uniref:EF-hand domain-containing protein n=1 Tax=Calicophoron daubneyi TaxID=300641 RepID=A0AAV2TR23_CALDB
MYRGEGQDKDFLVLLFYELEEIQGTVRTPIYEDLLRKYEFPESTASRYIEQFDPSESGQINKETLLQALGYPINYKPRVELSREVSILSSDMGPYQQYFIINMTDRYMKYFPNMKVVSKLKVRLDSVYGPLWHVFIIRGQYWGYYSHDTHTGLVFRRGDYIYLVYRSPTT